jgi:ribonuclease BN (tRNA processing enzyme)
MSLSFVPLGIGDAFSALFYSSCVAVEHDGRWMLIDCPHPIRKMLRENGPAGLDIDRVEGIALTHLHADHVSGLEGYAYFSFFALKKKARVVVHPSVRARLWEGCLAAGMEHLGIPGTEGARSVTLEEYFDIVDADETRAVSLGPFEIECRPTRHHIPTTAFRIRAGGATLAYSADTAFDPELVSWLSEADVVVHESNYGPAHTPYAKLAELPADLRAKMRLIHCPDDFDRGGSSIETLVQGKRYEVGTR